jgi:hypothetical protein
VENSVVVGRSAAICRTPDRRSAVEGVFGQGNVHTFRIVDRNNLKGGPTPINDREARAFPHTLDNIGK